MKKIFYILISLLTVFACSGEEQQGSASVGGGDNGGNDGTSATSITIDCVRTGNTDEIVLPQWETGVSVKVGEYTSKPLELISGTKAEFEFVGTFARPFNVLYPAEVYGDATKVIIGRENPVVPFAAYVDRGLPVWLKPVCGGVRMMIKGGYADSETAHTLSRVEVRGNRGEQMSGLFNLDYRSLALTSAETTEDSKVIRSTHSVQLSFQLEREVQFFLPAGTYESGLTLKLCATDNTFYEYVTPTSFVVEAGKYTDLPLIWYRPGEKQTLITGYVKDTSGNPISSVVVTDGLNTARTDSDGRYALPLNETEYTPKFVYLSTPREFAAPLKDGLPSFYKSWDECKTLQSVDFVLEPVANPDRYTLFVPADPQIRPSNRADDKYAFHSVDMMKDLFRDMREYSTAVDRNVYGIVLGDIVHHREMFPTHVEQCKTLSFPLYSVIGNHDHENFETEDEQHSTFERFMGPRNFSVNMGRFHLLSLDNIIMAPGGHNYSLGLSDQDMQWLRNDLKYVSEDTQLIVCAHAPMLMQSSGKDAYKSAHNGQAYVELFKKYAKVYHFAGHTHSMFNYVYGPDSEIPNAEVHVIARSGGILWLNEYIANGGAPRGYLVCEVDGERIIWKYRPIPYQTGEKLANPEPPYTFRTWTFNVEGIAYIGNERLNDSYQIGAFGKGNHYKDGYVYANVYMWDEEWGMPSLNVASRNYPMERVPLNNAYDSAEKELLEHYNSYLKDFNVNPSAINSLFKVKPPTGSGTGTIVVTDRFNQTFQTSVTW